MGWNRGSCRGVEVEKEEIEEEGRKLSRLRW